MGKAENFFRFFDVISDNMVLVDLLRPALDILIDYIPDEVIDGISGFYFA
jgi:hypothetical protein